MQLKSVLPGSRGAIGRLEQRVADLEADLAEMRQHNVRLAEIADLLQELLVPMASRDDAAVQRAIERFQESL
ncbi:MAG: hypothetical protein J2P22_01700 [Nocardioides sp.]|nr:hypothetical protein [Nocardioides sp.]